jgi:hypothetical protein
MFRSLFVFMMVLVIWPVVSSGQTQTIHGYIYDKTSGKGLPGIVVSDGYTVMVTDQKGAYSFTKHPSAAFVFFSTPAGYKIAHDGGVPVFYTRLEKDTAYNFYLEKEAVSDKKHLLVVAADPQPMTNEDGEKWMSFARKHFRPVLDKYKGVPALGIMCGDIVGDNHALYENHKQALYAIGIPFFQVLGNHDEDYGARTDDLSQHSFRKAFGPEYYSFNKGSIHYVVLDDIFYLGKPYRYTGYVAEAQLAWLEQDLKYVPRGSTVVVSVHIPIDFDSFVTPDEDDRDLLGGEGVSNREHLYSMLKPYKVHYMSGHTHWNQSFENTAGFHHIHGAICGQWWQSPTSSDGTPLGFAVYEVDGDSLSWYFQAAGEKRNHQMRIYQPDSNGRFVANIWNWDAGWKVMWYEDGKQSGDMKRITGYDPFISDFNKTLNHAWAWVKPMLTSHLFEASIKADTKTITVKAIDRFGNRYSASLKVNRQ